MTLGTSEWAEDKNDLLWSDWSIWFAQRNVREPNLLCFRMKIVRLQKQFL